MFWKFGFHNASSIDTLLDKDDISLEALLDEDDLLQECKAQNTRLIDYFQRTDVLQRLFGYVTGDIVGEKEGRFKYPYVATEVLCSEIWSIVETCLNNSGQLLAPFWESVLERSPSDMKTQNVMTSQFAKINAVFLGKRPAEMLAFIQAQPSVVERILRHIEAPSFVDLLIRIIQFDEHPAGAGVLEWLSAERLIPRLVDMLSPTQTIAVHSIVSELIKGIISMSAPSPGAGLTDGLQNGPASNLFARQLAQKDNVAKLVGFMLDEVPFAVEAPRTRQGNSTESQERMFELPPLSPTPSPPGSPAIPNIDTASSSGVHAISIIVELIRKNNSDYFEPYLFHTLRNRLIQVQQHMHMHTEDGREALERAMREMVNRMGVVHLGPLLEIMCEQLQRFQKLLHKPRSADEPILTTVGKITPLTFERFRICELYAELLHCSNMSLLNRPSEYAHLYDSEGRLQGGLSALEELARVIAIGSGSDELDNMDADGDGMEPAQELPVSSTSAGSSSLVDSDEDEDMSDDEEPSSSDDDVMEEIAMHDEPTAITPPISPSDEEPLDQPPLVVPSSPNAASMPPPSELAAQGAALARHRSFSGSRSNSSSSSFRARPRSSSSRRSGRRTQSVRPKGPLPIGDQLKQWFSETGVLSTLLDLFFMFPWNNFLHSVVYDVIHQILTGRVDAGLNRELTLALFRDARLLHRIVAGQRQNDIESSKPKGVRLGYMGHLTLISEDVIGALEHYPPDLRLLLAEHAPQPEWDDYVGGRYHETKKKDTSLLGGGKPVLGPGAGRGAARWKVDEEDAPGGPVNGSGGSNGVADVPEMAGEFRRTSRPMRESSADFGPAPGHDDELESSGPPQFARYLAQEMSSPAASSSDGSDEEDEDGGWLTQSKFDLGTPPVSARSHNSSRRPLSPSDFDDSFNPGAQPGSSSFGDRFGDDDDNFGPFSDDAATASDSDPFTLSVLSDDTEDSSFETFGDFGDFQSGDGDLTPTADSWTLSDASISSGSDDLEIDDADKPTDSPNLEGNRTQTMTPGRPS